MLRVDVVQGPGRMCGHNNRSDKRNDNNITLACIAVPVAEESCSQ